MAGHRGQRTAQMPACELRNGTCWPTWIPLERLVVAQETAFAPPSVGTRGDSKTRKSSETIREMHRVETGNPKIIAPVTCTHDTTSCTTKQAIASFLLLNSRVHFEISFFFKDRNEIRLSL